MPYYSAAYDIHFIEVVWDLGLKPVLTWSAPSAPTGIIKIWRSLGAGTVFEDAEVLTTLPLTATTYTDASATDDGISNLYWVVAYSPDGGIGGISYACLAIGQHGEISGTATGSGPSYSSDSTSFPDNHQPVDTVPWPGGTAKGRLLAQNTSYTAGSPTGPGTMNYDVDWHWDNPSFGNFDVVPLVGIDLPSAPYDSGVVTTVYGSALAKAVPAWVGTTGSYIGFPAGGATDPPYPTPGSFSGSMAGEASFQFTYVNPASGGGAATWPGSSPNTDVSGRPKNLPPLLLTFGGGNPLPVATPLPAVPCCRTECPVGNPGGRLI